MLCLSVFQAHPDVLTLMLQVFDEGRLTDGKVGLHTSTVPSLLHLSLALLMDKTLWEAAAGMVRERQSADTKTAYQEQTSGDATTTNVHAASRPCC